MARETMEPSLFMAMCRIANEHAGIVQAAEIIWVTDGMDSVLTADRKQRLADGSLEDQRLAQRHGTALVALQVEAGGHVARNRVPPPTREDALKALNVMSQWLTKGCPGGPWRGMEQLSVLRCHFGLD